MKYLTFIMVCGLLSVAACSHRSKCGGQDKVSCDKKEESSCNKEKKNCAGGKCSKDENEEKK